MARDPAHRFKAHIGSFSPELPRLPLMHTTKGRRFVSIMDEREIAVGPRDEHIGKEVSFHFYGKPSYRPESVGTYTSQMGSALFCMVLDMAALPPPCSMLPFDSGGYKERFAEQCDGIDLNEFYLPLDPDSPGRVVSAIYGSNYDYYMTNARSGATPAISRFDLHSSGLMRLGSATGPVGFDQRAASIEVHFDVPIRLTPENVLAIVGPDLACEEPEMIDFAASLDADLQPYAFDMDDPSVRQRQVRDAVKAWLVRKNYMAG